MMKLAKARRTCQRLAISLALGVLFSGPANAAGGWSLSAVPTSIHFVRNEGFILYGAFGNSGATPCGVGDALWIPIAHPQYQGLLSASLTAVTAGLKIQGYTHGCTMVGWVGATFAEVSAGSALIITK
jgi:hypothetical protein